MPSSSRSTVTPASAYSSCVVEHVAQPVGIEHGPAGQDAVLAVRDERDLVAAGDSGLASAAERTPPAGDAGIRSFMPGWSRDGGSVASRPGSTGCASIPSMTTDTAGHRPTLMTVHAHPDDETIGTGGAMAKAVEAGHRVVLVTGTRGELGEIVVPDMDTPDNHRRLGEIRAGELERAMGVLGVTEWENLGYRDSGMMGTDGNRDPRSFWQADLDEAAGRLTWLVRRYQPDVMTTYNEFGGYGHPDHIRTHDVAVRAFERAGDPAWYPEQLEEPGARAVGAVEALRAGDPGVGPRADGRHGWRSSARSVLGAARGRDARADRRVRGVRREDARPR